LKSRFDETTGEELQYLERMQSAASRMSRLIRDLLNFSRITVHQPVRKEVSLNQVVQEALVDLDLVVEETRAQVSIHPLPLVVGDALQLGQLFGNLLSNALKFRQAGLVPIIEIKASQTSAEDLPPGIEPARKAVGYHLIEVVDNGIGFEEKYLDRMFEVFQRLHNRNAYSGTGIGLAIAQKVVLNHGGALTATSLPGHGATFSIYLPNSLNG
jgi:signal transduction histidine kinase